MTTVELLEATDAYTYLAVRGRLDSQGVGAADLELTRQTVPRRKPAVVDLADVPLLTSLGIGMLVRIARAMASHGLKLVAVAPHEPAKGLLRLLQLDAVLPLAETREEALRLLGVE